MRALYGVGQSVPLQRVLREHRAVLIPLALLLAANLIVLVAIVAPLSQRVSSSEQRAQSAERERAAAEAEFRRAEALRASRARAAEDLEAFYATVLPESTAAARRILHLKVQQQAREHGVRFEGGGYTEEALRDSRLYRLTTQIRLSGTYDDIRTLIHALETSPDFVVIDSLSLAESTAQDTPLSVSLALSTYYRAPDAVPARHDGR